MTSIEQIFLLLVGCVINGSTSNLKDVCTTSDMHEIPYQAMGVDQRLPKFEEGHWYTFKVSESVIARLEVLVKDGAVLQAGVETVYPKSSNVKASDHFEKIADIANHHYGRGMPIGTGGIDNLNYGDRKSVFYIIKGNMNGHPFVVFRAGNRRFWP